jgi:hypothetical protein
MQRNGISEQMLQSYIADELYIARLVRAYRVEVDRELALQLLMSNPDHPRGSVPSSGSAPSA